MITKITKEIAKVQEDTVQMRADCQEMCEQIQQVKQYTADAEFQYPNLVTRTINLAEFINEFNKEVYAKESAIAELAANGDFEDSKTVLLMQQMINEWSFMVGLSSALAKTIKDTLNGIVQKI